VQRLQQPAVDCERAFQRLPCGHVAVHGQRDGRELFHVYGQRGGRAKAQGQSGERDAEERA